MKFWKHGVAWMAAVVAVSTLGACSAGKEASDADAANIEATMVYYAMPG